MLCRRGRLAPSLLIAVSAAASSDLSCNGDMIPSTKLPAGAPRTAPVVRGRRAALRRPWAIIAVLATTWLPAPARAQTIEEKAQLCAACHGENGIPQDKTTPVIWGQYQGYLYLDLRDYKSGARKNDIMSPLAQTLERDDMMALALYFSQKRWPDLQQPSAPPDVAARAIRANASVGCTGCHQGQYQGEGTQPRLAGQSQEYLRQTMIDFRTRARGNNPGMTDLMLATSEDDIAALAQYMAGLQYLPGQ
jgi:cytochrome c553